MVESQRIELTDEQIVKILAMLEQEPLQNFQFNPHYLYAARIPYGRGWIEIGYDSIRFQPRFGIEGSRQFPSLGNPLADRHMRQWQRVKAFMEERLAKGRANAEAEISRELGS